MPAPTPGPSARASARSYACTFPALIKGWRAAFRRRSDGTGPGEIFFGFMQLSTWCADPGDSVAQMRDAQMAAAVAQHPHAPQRMPVHLSSMGLHQLRLVRLWLAPARHVLFVYGF